MMNREQATALAIEQAKIHKPSYYYEPFVPHEWVIAAIMEASKEIPDHKFQWLNIKCVTQRNAGDRSGGIKGVMYLPVIRIEQEDNGTYTAVTDYWPKL